MYISYTYIYAHVAVHSMPLLSHSNITDLIIFGQWTILSSDMTLWCIRCDSIARIFVNLISAGLKIDVLVHQKYAADSNSLNRIPVSFDIGYGQATIRNIFS